MPLLYSIEEHKKDKHKYAMITGFDGNVSNLVVPCEIDGYPVEAIGNHAFSARQDLVSVELPESIKTLYGFAFHNCRNLRKITLFDSLDDYYDGVCRQCDSLKIVEITINRSWYEVVRNFLADNDRTLKFVLHINDCAVDNTTAAGDTVAIGAAPSHSAPVTAVLTFPEYVYDFNENTMARTIQFSIAGSGMFYRECVDRRSMGYRQYDRLFEKAVIDGNSISEDIALGRLLYPVELADTDRATYECFVRKNSSDILKRLVETSDEDPESLETVKALLDYDKDLVSNEALDMALKIATDKGFTHMSAILMNGNKSASNTGVGEFIL